MQKTKEVNIRQDISNTEYTITSDSYGCIFTAALIDQIKNVTCISYNTHDMYVHLA